MTTQDNQIFVAICELLLARGFVCYNHPAGMYFESHVNGLFISADHISTFGSVLAFQLYYLNFW